MKNLLSYCGLVDAKIRASAKDLPVLDIVAGNCRATPTYITLLFVMCGYSQLTICKIVTHAKLYLFV